VPFRYGDMRLGYWAEVSHDEMAHYTGIAMLLFAAVGLVTMRRDRDRWLPGLQPGDLAASELNPLVFKR